MSFSVIRQFRRYLTSAQAATALRPFYFAVHPDLFGQHPNQQAVNEDSLKQLSEHLEKLMQNKKVIPITIKFYVRNTSHGHQNLPYHRPYIIYVKLLQKSPLEFVKTVLQSCGLSLEYINTVQPIRKQERQQRPIRWDPSFHSMYGMRDPESPQVKPVMNLSSWLESNITKARTRQSNIKPIRQEVSRIREELLRVTGLRDVIWDSGWSQTQHRAVLKGLLRLCTQHTDISLTGKIIRLGDATGVCCHGNILLKSNDIAESWLWILRSMTRYEPLVNKLPTAELYLSTLLNGANITRTSQHPPLVEVYLQELRRLAAAVKSHSLSAPTALTEDLTDVSVVIECMTGPLLVAPSGVVRISSTSPGFIVFDFLNKNVSKARQKKLTHALTRDLCDELMNQCYTKLRVEYLTYSDNISPEQVVTCCRQLLEDAKTLSVSLDGASLQISNFFSVTSEGTLCVPWNYGQLSENIGRL